jgi:hypothetical protein
MTKKLYALKYIEKASCIKKNAVGNILQERKLLEEVSFGYYVSCVPELLRHDRLTIHILSTYDMRFKMTKTVSLFWI